VTLAHAPGKWAYLFWATFYGLLHLSLNLNLVASDLEFGSTKYNWLTGAIILGPLAYWIDLYYRFMAKAALLHGVVISVHQVLGGWALFAVLASMVLIWPDVFAGTRLFPLGLPIVMVMPLAQGLMVFRIYFMNEKFND
jgi:hypothetical protein